MAGLGSWLWGSSASTTNTSNSSSPVEVNSNSPMHMRPLSAIKREDKEQLLNDFKKQITEKETNSTVCVDTPNLKIWRKQLVGEEIHQIKFLGTLPYPIDLIDYVLNTPEIRKQWDTVLEVEK